MLFMDSSGRAAAPHRAPIRKHVFLFGVPTGSRAAARARGSMV
jgi:hypothetical protein